MSDNVIKKPRKQYAKPRIAIEEFTHNQFIANCAVNALKSGWQEDLRDVSFLDYMAVVRGHLFTKGLDECLTDADADYMTEDMDTLCYHTSTSPLFWS